MGGRTVGRATASELPEKIGNLLQESRWLALGALALFMAMAFWGFNKEDPGWSHAVSVAQLHNPTGHAGAWIADLALYLCGLVAYLGPLLLLAFGWLVLRGVAQEERSPLEPTLRLLGFIAIIVSAGRACGRSRCRYLPQAERRADPALCGAHTPRTPRRSPRRPGPVPRPADRGTIRRRPTRPAPVTTRR